MNNQLQHLVALVRGLTFPAIRELIFGSGSSLETGRSSRLPMTFIDLFSGCGGLSLGLLQAGWQGMFAIEKNSDAFRTFRHNLVDANSRRPPMEGFEWPDWLPIEAIDVDGFLSTYRSQLAKIQGSVTLIAGGPPCQGFSFAGQRQADDPRNQLFTKHMEIVDLVRPELVFLENVQGFSIGHGRKEWLENGRKGRAPRSYADRIKELLVEHGYEPQQALVRACDFGVPQLRPRYLTLGIRRDLLTKDCSINFFDILESKRVGFLTARGLPVAGSVSVEEAISDLRTKGKSLVKCDDPESPSGFNQIAYDSPESAYQRLMHGSLNGQPMDSLRLVNHRPETIQHFEQILETCRKGVQLSNQDRERLGIKKNAIVPLAPKQPSHTLTTLPDDLLHYAEPRVHTVREHARLQSFPDWLEFKGKYTTGGKKRTQECPRYTQVGNAVPPLLAEAIGVGLDALLLELEKTL